MNKGEKFQYELINISHYYKERKVLDIPYFAVEKGKIYAIVGPNGSGKTTLLHIMSGLTSPTKGCVYFEGKPIYPCSNNGIKINKHATLLIQNSYLFNCTVRKNIEYGLKVRKIPKKLRKSIVFQLLKELDIEKLEKRPAKELSGGEVQLVALARALAVNPKALLLDEPTSGIDSKHEKKLLNILIDINRKRKTTIIFTTHNLHQAFAIADKIFSLTDGHICHQLNLKL